MARDNSILTAPRSSGFALLISDDEESSSTITNNNVGVMREETVDAPAENGQVEGGAIHSANSEMTEDWSLATNKKQQPHHQRKGSKSNGHHNSNARGGHVAGKKGGYGQVSLESFTPENTLEIFDFPAAWRTSDIKKMLLPFEGQYRLKWQSDTSCWVHFEEEEVAKKALDELKPEEASLRHFAPENVQNIAPKTDIQPTAETTIELYGFPSSWKAQELNDLLASWSGKYKIKWRNEASCYVIFDSSELVKEAVTVLAAEQRAKVRSFTSIAH